MAKRSPIIGAAVKLALSSLADDAADEDEATIYAALALALTPNQRLQLRWLLTYAVLHDVVKGAYVKSRCRVAVEKHFFPDTSPPSAMVEAWSGQSGCGRLARALANKTTPEEKAEIIADLMPLVPPVAKLP